MKREKLLAEAFQKKDDWLMNINKEVFMEPYLAETVVLY